MSSTPESRHPVLGPIIRISELVAVGGATLAALYLSTSASDHEAAEALAIQAGVAEQAGENPARIQALNEGAKVYYSTANQKHGVGLWSARTGALGAAVLIGAQASKYVRRRRSGSKE